MHFEWDDKKNLINQRKHQVSFEEATTIFFDPMTKVAEDVTSTGKERRFIAIGYSANQRLLLVIHCFRQSDDLIRIVSARKATKRERKQYEDEL